MAAPSCSCTHACACNCGIRITVAPSASAPFAAEPSAPPFAADPDEAANQSGLGAIGIARVSTSPRLDPDEAWASAPPLVARDLLSQNGLSDAFGVEYCDVLDKNGKGVPPARLFPAWLRPTPSP